MCCLYVYLQCCYNAQLFIIALLQRHCMSSLALLALFSLSVIKSTMLLVRSSRRLTLPLVVKSASVSKLLLDPSTSPERSSPFYLPLFGLSSPKKVPALLPTQGGKGWLDHHTVMMKKDEEDNDVTGSWLLHVLGSQTQRAEYLPCHQKAGEGAPWSSGLGARAVLEWDLHQILGRGVCFLSCSPSKRGCSWPHPRRGWGQEHG